MWVGRRRRFKISAVPQSSISGLFLIVPPRGFWKSLLFSVAQSLPDSVSCHHFILLLKATENEGGFLTAGEMHPESSGVARLCFGSPSEDLCWCLGAGDQSLLALGTPVRKGRAAWFPEQGGSALLHILNFLFTVLLHSCQLGGFIRHLFLVYRTFHRADKRFPTNLVGPHCTRPLVKGRENVCILNSYFCILGAREHFIETPC